MPKRMTTKKRPPSIGQLRIGKKCEEARRREIEERRLKAYQSQSRFALKPRPQDEAYREQVNQILFFPTDAGHGENLDESLEENETLSTLIFFRKNLSYNQEDSSCSSGFQEYDRDDRDSDNDYDGCYV